MKSSIFFSLLFLATFWILPDRSMAEDGSGGGFHGNERDALLMLKQGLKNSFLDGNWTSIMCYMNDTPYWYGVQCLNGRVTGLMLETMWLVGEIKKDSLVNLTELTNLSFKGNSLSGNLMDFSHNLKLRNIDLSGNSFLGEIPPSILNLNSLESLQLQDNNLTGHIPGLNQSSLKIFNVSHNNLSGSIPETETLQSFDVSSYTGNPNLCGRPTQTSCSIKIKVSNETKSVDSSSANSGSGSHFIAILVVANVIALVVILFLFIIYYKKYKKLKQELKIKIPRKEEEHDSTIISRAQEKGALEGGRGKLVFMENGGTRFDLDDLLKASAEGLGRGSFGNCYKANLEVGQAVVVKRIRDLKPLSNEEFVRQVTAIADQKHPNLLPLLAYYYSKAEKLFVYRFAANGNIYNRLHGGRGSTSRVPFRWSARLSVASSVARVLEYLHQNTRSQTAVPHGNLKSTNVLLDENDEILVTDYGLTSVIALPIAAQRMVAYRCPEYQSQKRISKKSDVWSYGCLLLELLSGRVPAHAAPAEMDGVDLCAWAHRAVREEWTAEIFDSEIAVQRGANQGMLKLMRVAMRCCEKLPENRPEMGQVVADVEEIRVSRDSDEEHSYSSLERSLTDDSYSVASSPVIEVDRRRR